MNGLLAKACVLAIIVCSAGRAETPEPTVTVEESVILWNYATEKSVRDEKISFRHRLIKEADRFYLEFEHRDLRKRLELVDDNEKVEISAGSLLVTVSEVRVNPEKRLSARVTVEALKEDTSFTLQDKTCAVNYARGIQLLNGRFVPGYDELNHIIAD